MNYKYRFMNIHLFERKALEDYFSHMAANGWQVDRLRYGYVRFHKEKPQQRYYHIGFHDKIGYLSLPYAEGENSDYTGFMESFGYTYVSSIGVAQLFVSSEDQPFFSEPEIDEAAFRKAVFKDEFSKSILPFILMLLLFIMTEFPFYLDSLASNATLLLNGMEFLLIVYFFGQMIPYLRYLQNHKECINRAITTRFRAYHIIFPCVFLTVLLFFFLPTSLFVPTILVIALLMTMRLGLRFVTNHTVHKKLWQALVIAGYAVAYLVILNIGHDSDPTPLRVKDDKPFMTAADFKQPVKTADFESQQSILLKVQYYTDEKMSYRYLKVADTPLSGLIEKRILSDYQLSLAAYEQHGSVRVYHVSGEYGDQVEVNILVKQRNYLLIYGKLKDAYLTFFENHV